MLVREIYGKEVTPSRDLNEEREQISRYREESMAGRRNRIEKSCK